MIRKLVIAAVLIPAVWFGTAAMHFPPIFQKMFILYVLLGLTVFLLLDAPSFPNLAGWKAVAALIGFYAVLSASYIGGASFLPQYDPTVEKGKIDKIVKPKLETPEARRAKLEEMVKKSEALQARSGAILASLEKLAPSAPVLVCSSSDFLTISSSLARRASAVSSFGLTILSILPFSTVGSYWGRKDAPPMYVAEMTA